MSDLDSVNYINLKLEKPYLEISDLIAKHDLTVAEGICILTRLIFNAARITNTTKEQLRSYLNNSLDANYCNEGVL